MKHPANTANTVIYSCDVISYHNNNNNLSFWRRNWRENLRNKNTTERKKIAAVFKHPLYQIGTKIRLPRRRMSLATENSSEMLWKGLGNECS